MIIDCHFHLEKRLVSMETLWKKMDAAGIDRVALMAPVVDPFAEPSPFLISALQFMLFHRPLRWAGQAAVSNFTAKGEIKILGRPYPIYAELDNATVFRAVDMYPDRFLGWVFVNPAGKQDPAAEYARWRGHPGCVGVKAHPFWHRYPPESLVPVAQMAAADNRPVLIHAGFGPHGDFDALLQKVPGLKLILAHAGFPLYADTWRAIRSRTNVFVDLSQTSYVGEGILAKAVEALGPDRCVFGTDGPFGFHGDDHTFDMGLIKTRIEQAFPDSRIRKMLLGENFMQVANIHI